MWKNILLLLKCELMAIENDLSRELEQGHKTEEGDTLPPSVF